MKNRYCHFIANAMNRKDRPSGAICHLATQPQACHEELPLIVAANEWKVAVEHFGILAADCIASTAGASTQRGIAIRNPASIT
jgi:hypothetical protein